MILLFSGNKMVFFTQNKTVSRRRLTSNFVPKCASSKKMNDARNIQKLEMIFAQLNFSVWQTRMGSIAAQICLQKRLLYILT